MSFKRLDPQDFITSADSITSPTWSGNVSTLTTFYTSSAQTNSPQGNYYLNVYDKNPTTNISSEIQFSIAYASRDGGGSLLYNPNIAGKSYSSTLYGQMRNLLLEDENSSFILGDYFYVVNINRARYKEKLMPGTWSIKIGSSNYTDCSSGSAIPEFYGSQRVYRVGIANTPGGAGVSSTNGLFFPDTSIILFRHDVCGTSNTTNSAAHNERSLFSAINSFKLLSEETITSNYVFVRARNSEFNYSENPSFISGSTGEVLYDSFIYNPQTYPTTVGLYNDGNELLAVAKLSKPLLKDATKEVLLRLKIDF